jgi:hypothetical protein
VPSPHRDRLANKCSRIESRQVAAAYRSDGSLTRVPGTARSS